MPIPVLKNRPEKPCELSAYTSDGMVFIAENLCCPGCNRPVRCYDFEPLHDGFQIICAGCGLTLAAYRKHVR